MTVRLNHTIVPAHDKEKSALFFSEILGLEPPALLGPFALITVGDGLTLDFMATDGEIASQHYAFLVSETEFDQIFARIKGRQLPYWADPHQTKRGEINQWDDGRGVYFEDPNGHLLEILTRSYGTAGTAADHPHPLVVGTLEPQNGDDGAKQRAKAPGGGKLACAEHPDPRKSN
jgi:catechol 2,3-dioxygenase-like lactoylglutathione lyase family enzyme